MTSWESIQRTYEGFPLYLRRPTGLDFDSLSPRLPIRLTLTHEFSFRRADGAPEAAYNSTLEDFDLSVTRLFAGTAEGQVVLVETFGGKRHYYFYVAPAVNAQAILDDLRARFPALRLDAATKPDPGWRFIRGYTADYIDTPQSRIGG